MRLILSFQNGNTRGHKFHRTQGAHTNPENNLKTFLPKQVLKHHIKQKTTTPPDEDHTHI